MSSQLPYFRFTVQDWQNGKIALENYELQGLFISVCGYYWINDCSVTLAMLKKRFRDASTLIDELIKLGIIKHEKKHDKVEIEFLNLQYDLLSEKRKSRQLAGSKGGNAKAKLKQKPSYKDNNNNKDNNKDNNKELDFGDFTQACNRWLKYKSDRKEKYVSVDSVQTFVKKLIKLSDSNPIKANLIIEQSIANNWAGIFELKQQSQPQQTTTTPTIKLGKA